MRITSLIVTLILTIPVTSAQNQQGTRERIKVYSQAIEGNLVGDPAERDATVYLPPSYQTGPEKRYPVLYMSHGHTDSESKWLGWEEHRINLCEVSIRP